MKKNIFKAIMCFLLVAACLVLSYFYIIDHLDLSQDQTQQEVVKDKDEFYERVM